MNAASGAVWNECWNQMDMYPWHRGSPHAHNHFYFGKDCEGWIDQRLSHPLLHSQSRPAVRERYFKSWKSYRALKKSGSVENPKPLTNAKAI